GKQLREQLWTKRKRECRLEVTQTLVRIQSPKPKGFLRKVRPRRVRSGA
uniref:Uncharacterized protein n=1 Tax=Cucumis melo TaxID=3656 RepID=A0A9I9E7C8_CUCME